MVIVTRFLHFINTIIAYLPVQTLSKNVVGDWLTQVWIMIMVFYYNSCYSCSSIKNKTAWSVLQNTIFIYTAYRDNHHKDFNWKSL